MGLFILGFILGESAGVFIMCMLQINREKKAQDRIDKVIHFILEENMTQRKTTKEEKIIIEMLRGEDK